MGTHDLNNLSDEEDPSLALKEAASDHTILTESMPDSFSQETDGRDEHDAYSSDLGYSDDSASLSDSYFYPQMEDLGKQPPPPAALDSMPLLHSPPLYGSIPDRSASPLWRAEPIQEDMEMEELVHHPVMHSPVATETGHARRKEKRKRRRMHWQQHTSPAIRSHAQPDHRWKDKWFAVAFLIQFSIVCLCAARFGVSVLLAHNPRSSASWRPGGRFHWERQRPEQDFKQGNRHQEVIVEANGTSTSKSVSPSYIHSDARTDDYVDINDQPSTADYKKDSFVIDYHNVIALVGITGFYACVLTYLSFGFMLILARHLVQIMLTFSVVLSLAWGMIGLYLDPYGLISALGFGALLLAIGHTIYSWNRISFASTNLYTSLCAMRCTADITILGLTSLFAALGWCSVWSMAFIGIVNAYNEQDCNYEQHCEPEVSRGHLPLLVVLLFSLYWTSTVIKNVVRATVASAIGSWWFYPREMSPLCCPAVLKPLSRSLSSSLGSICFGSLVVQLAEFVSFFTAPNDGRGSSCLMAGAKIASEKNSEVVADGPNDHPDSAADTVGLSGRLTSSLNGFAAVLRTCNRWSFTYIGMYSYSFLEAGERALQLFETRDRTGAVRDTLIHNILLMSCIVIGGSTGIFAAVVEETDGFEFSSFSRPVTSAFIVGALMGFILSDILLLGFVGSAVNTVLICFASAPMEFERNHPILSRDMREAWSLQVWEPAAAVAPKAYGNHFAEVL